MQRDINNFIGEAHANLRKYGEIYAKTLPAVRDAVNNRSSLIDPERKACALRILEAIGSPLRDVNIREEDEQNERFQTTLQVIKDRAEIFKILSEERELPDELKAKSSLLIDLLDLIQKACLIDESFKKTRLLPNDARVELIMKAYGEGKIQFDRGGLNVLVSTILRFSDLEDVFNLKIAKSAVRRLLEETALSLSARTCLVNWLYNSGKINVLGGPEYDHIPSGEVADLLKEKFLNSDDLRKKKLGEIFDSMLGDEGYWATIEVDNKVFKTNIINVRNTTRADVGYSTDINLQNFVVILISKETEPDDTKNILRVTISERGVISQITTWEEGPRFSDENLQKVVDEIIDNVFLVKNESKK